MSFGCGLNSNLKDLKDSLSLQGEEEGELDARDEVQAGELQLGECLGTGAFAEVKRLSFPPEMNRLLSPPWG